MIACHETDRLDLRARLHAARLTVELEVLDHGDRITVGQHVPVGVADVAEPVVGLAEPFVAAGGALVAVVGDQRVGHRADRTVRRITHGACVPVGTSISAAGVRNVDDGSR